MNQPDWLKIGKKFRWTWIILPRGFFPIPGNCGGYLLVPVDSTAPAFSRKRSRCEKKRENKHFYKKKIPIVLVVQASFSPSFFFFLFITFINQYISCSLCTSLFLCLCQLLFKVVISLIFYSLSLSQSISPWLTSLFLTHSVSFNISSSAPYLYFKQSLFHSFHWSVSHFSIPPFYLSVSFYFFP